MHMSLQNDVGQATYEGPASVKPDLPALRQVVLYDAFEGQMGWYIGTTARLRHARPRRRERRPDLRALDVRIPARPPGTIAVVSG